MGEHSLRARSNGKLMKLQRLRDRVGIPDWKMRFKSKVPGRRAQDFLPFEQVNRNICGTFYMP